jgi:hypothetical protein
VQRGKFPASGRLRRCRERWLRQELAVAVRGIGNHGIGIATLLFGETSDHIFCRHRFQDCQACVDQQPLDSLESLAALRNWSGFQFMHSDNLVNWIIDNRLINEKPRGSMFCNGWELFELFVELFFSARDCKKTIPIINTVYRRQRTDFRT